MTLKFGFDGKRIKEENGTVTFPITITSEGVYNNGLRTAEEIERIAPLMDGLPIIIDHTPTPDVPPETTKYGKIQNPVVTVKNGLKVVQAEAVLDDIHMELIERVETEQNSEVSLGYWFEEVLAGGDFQGDAYTHIRTEIKPTHVAILFAQSPAACPTPQCNIGLDSTSSIAIDTSNDNGLISGPSITPHDKDNGMKRRVFIPGNDSRIDESNIEGCINMTDEPKQKEKIVKSKSKDIAIADIGLDTLIQEHPCVKKLSEQNQAMSKELTDSKAGQDKLIEQVKELLPFKEEADKRELEEVLALRSEVQSAKVYEDEEVNAMGRDMLEPILVALKSAGRITDIKMTAGPGSDKQKNGAAPGIPYRDESGNLQWRD